MENNEKKQLELIAETIQSARQQFSDTSYIYLIWGWAVGLAALLEFALIRLKYDNYAIVWAISMPIALILQVALSIRRKKREEVRSHIDKTFGYLWSALGVSMVLVLVSANHLQLGTYPVLIFLYGIGTFVSGGLMNFKVMMAGGIACWVIGTLAFYTGFETQLLLLALSVVLSYIIPGHLLNIRMSKHVSRS